MDSRYHTDDGGIIVQAPGQAGRVLYDNPEPSQATYMICVSDNLTVEGAVGCLNDVMEALSLHPNIDPMAFQGALMSAMMQQGK